MRNFVTVAWKGTSKGQDQEKESEGRTRAEVGQAGGKSFFFF